MAFVVCNFVGAFNVLYEITVWNTGPIASGAGMSIFISPLVGYLVAEIVMREEAEPTIGKKTERFCLSVFFGGLIPLSGLIGGKVAFNMYRSGVLPVKLLREWMPYPFLIGFWLLPIIVAIIYAAIVVFLIKRRTVEDQH